MADLPEGRPGTRDWLFAALLALVAVAVDAPVVRHGYVFDDTSIVRDNAVVREHRYAETLTSPYWPETELTPAAANWRPLAVASLAVEQHLFGRRAKNVHHATNALLHGLVVLALFPLAWRLCRGPWALAACAIFAFHPAHVEVTAPIVGRTDLLAALGAIVALECYLRFRDGSGGAWLAAGAAAYAVGLAAKESAAPILLLLPVADWLLGGRPLRSLLGRNAMGWLPFVGVAVVYLLLRAAVLGGRSFAHEGAVDYTLLERVVFTTRNAVVSLGLLVVPARFHHVVTTLPGSAAVTYPDPTGGAAAAYLVGAAFIALGWIPLVRLAPRAAFVWLAAGLTWAPTSGLLPAAAGVSLRFLFLPSAFYACGLGLALAAASNARPGWRPVLIGATALLVVTSAALSWRRQADWRTNGTFYAAVIRERPDCHTAQYSLGSWYSTRKPPKLDLAREHLEQAILVTGETPQSFETRLNLAITWELGTSGERYAAGCDLDEAVRQYETMIRLFPDRWEPHMNLAVILERRRDPGAATHLRRVLELKPDHPDAEAIRRRLR